MNKFNEKEFLNLCKNFHTEPFTKEITIKYEGNSYFNKIKKAVKDDRCGEVVFCVIRPNGKAITVTCAEYPRDIFRIPTGGLGHQEDIAAGVFRETKEELGLDAEIIKFAGVLKVRFEYKNELEMFYSYLFILKETGGRLLFDASDDEVSEVREVGMEGLEEMVHSLKHIEGPWKDWGKFRAATSGAVLDILKENPGLIGAMNEDLVI